MMTIEKSMIDLPPPKKRRSPRVQGVSDPRLQRLRQIQAELLKEWERSGRSYLDLCRTFGVSKGAMDYWLYDDRACLNSRRQSQKLITLALLRGQTLEQLREEIEN